MGVFMPQQRFSEREMSRDFRSPFRTGVILLTGIAIGSGLMYLLDPRAGNRRRSVARDKLLSVGRHSFITGGKTYRHLRNRLQGVLAVLGDTLRPGGVVTDRKLADRIRATVGRTIPHPHAVDFAVHEGRVTVRGSLKPHEAGLVIRAVERVHGVKSVDNQILDSSSVTGTVQ